MEQFKKIFRKLAGWFKSSYKAKFVKDIPEIFDETTVYVVGDIHSPWVLVFQCPCGCKKIIQLNTLKEARPKWDFHIFSNKKIDISPSIWRTSGCKSHFLIRKGKLYWC